MDKEFNEIISGLGKWENLENIDKQEESFDVEFDTQKKGLIKVKSEKGEVSFNLKKLNELYDESIKDDSQEHLVSLIFPIELLIRDFDTIEEELTDSRIISTLEKLSMKPEMESNDSLLTMINLKIRFQLSIGNYSRANVRQALRKVIKSAKLHNDLSGKRGYIDFLYQFLPK